MTEASIQAQTGERRRAETRLRLLAATREYLASGNTLAALSVASITSAAGLSRATFYLHYDDKRELFADLAETELSEGRELLAPLLGDPSADRDALARTVDELIAMWRRHAPVLTGILELTSYDAEAKAGWEAQLESLIGDVAAYLQRRDPGGEGDHDMRARVLAWSVISCFTHVLGTDDEQAERLARTVTEVAWGLIGPP